METVFIKNLENQSHNKEEKKYIIDDTELRIFKNFLSDNDYKKLVNIIITYLHSLLEDEFKTNVTSNIMYGHSSIGWHPYYVPHWNFLLTDNEFFSKYLFTKIKNICEWTNKLQIKRIYCSCQTSEQFGNWHYDDKDENAFTFVLYCNLKRD